jgi:hypothetical protein
MRPAAALVCGGATRPALPAVARRKLPAPWHANCVVRLTGPAAVAAAVQGQRQRGGLHESPLEFCHQTADTRRRQAAPVQNSGMAARKRQRLL